MNPWETLPDDAVMVHVGMQAGLGDMTLAMTEDEAFRLFEWYETNQKPKFRVRGLTRRDGKFTQAIVTRDCVASLLMHYKPEPAIMPEEKPEGSALQ